MYAGTTETNANWQQTITARAALKWQLNDKVAVEPSLYYQSLHINDTTAYWQVLSNPGAGIFATAMRSRTPVMICSICAALKVHADLGSPTLTSTTSYLSRDQQSTSDYTQYNRATYAYYGYLPNIYPRRGSGLLAVCRPAA